MRMHSYLTLALVPAALVAQAPANPDYMAVLKVTKAEVDDQLKDFHPLEALQKVEAALPAELPAFDKSSPGASLKCSISMSGLTRLYLLAAKVSGQAGDWDKVLDNLTKAQACAKVNYENTNAVLTPMIASWTQAMEKSQKVVDANGERIKTLQAKPGRTPAEEKDVETFIAKDKVYRETKVTSEKNEAAKYLQANQPHYLELLAKVISPAEQQEIDAFKVAQANLAQGPKTVQALQGNIDAAKAELDTCAPKIESITKNIHDEGEEEGKFIADFKVKGKLVKETSGPKFEDKKAKYFESVLTTASNYTSRPAKQDKLNFLFRLRHKVAGTALEAKVDETIDRVRKDEEPIPAPKKGGKGKKA